MEYELRVSVPLNVYCVRFAEVGIVCPFMTRCLVVILSDYFMVSLKLLEVKKVLLRVVGLYCSSKLKKNHAHFCFFKFFFGKIGNFCYFALMMKYSIFLVIYTSIWTLRICPLEILGHTHINLKFLSLFFLQGLCSSVFLLRYIRYPGRGCLFFVNWIFLGQWIFQ